MSYKSTLERFIVSFDLCIAASATLVKIKNDTSELEPEESIKRAKIVTILIDIVMKSSIDYRAALAAADLIPNCSHTIFCEKYKKRKEQMINYTKKRNAARRAEIINAKAIIA